MAFNPSSYTIVSFTLRNRYTNLDENIAGMIDGIEINQSMGMTSWSGVAAVLDTVGFLDNTPLLGEEQLILKIVSHDLDTEYDLACQVIRIDNLVPTESMNGVRYNIHFISAVTYAAAVAPDVEEGFTDKSINQIAEYTFRNYFTSLGAAVYTDGNRTFPYATAKYPLINFVTNESRKFTIQPTIGLNNLAIPHYTASETMLFLARRAYGEANSQTYRFFENLNDYFFVTDEYLIKESVEAEDEIQKFFYSPNASYDPREPEKQLNRIEYITIGSRGSDIGKDIKSGGYTSTVCVVDILNHEYSESTYKYTEEAEFVDMSGVQARRGQIEFPHTREYAEETFRFDNGPRFLAFRDFTGPYNTPRELASDQRLDDMVSNRIAYRHHLYNTKVSASLTGRMDIMPGQLIDLTVQGFDALGTSDNHQQLSGRYLVFTTKHTLENDRVRTNFELVKYDWSSD
jgi:hypothetical protein